MSNPFKEAAQEYFDKGWSPVPLPYQKKANPPSGYTGRAATKTVDQTTLDKWLKSNTPRNIAIRIPDDVIGIDVDNYEGHGGAETLAALEAEHGVLPGTCLVTSRDDGISGIRLYRVPSGVSWSGKYGPGIDIIQSGHRYAVVWPSVHPSGRTYRWRDNQVPGYSDLPDLPESLVNALSQGPVGEVLAAADITTTEAQDWLNALPGGRYCWEVYGLVEKMRDDIQSNRHDTMKNGQWSLVKSGVEGHRGVRKALAELRDMFYEEILGDAEREQLAGHEFFSALNTAVKKNYEEDQWELCNCGEVPDLEEGEEMPPRPPKGSGKGLVLTPASEIKPKATIWLWGPTKDNREQDGFVPLGQLVLLAGAENLGKSTLAADMASNLSRGTMRGKFKGHPKAVFIATTEDSWEQTIAPRLLAANADMNKVYRIEAADYGPVSLPRDIPDFERKVKEKDAAMLILDPLNSTLDSKLDTHKDADVRRALEPLVKVSQRAGCTIIGLIHKNKSSTTDPNTSIMGSRAYVAVARAVLYVAQDPDNPDIRILGVPKNNLGKTNPQSLTFTIVEKAVGWDKEIDEAITASKLEWTGKSDLKIQDVMEQSKGRGGGRGHPTQEWLTNFLQTEARCVPVHEIMAAAKEAGISESAVRRAKKELDVEEVKTKTFPTKTCWQDAAQKLLEGMMEGEDT